MSLALGAALLGALLTTPTATAGVADDILGVGARTRAMGGAGTAEARDPSAAYYNPANLAFCRTNTLVADGSYAAWALKVNPGDDADPPAVSPKPRPSGGFGACLHLPLRLSAGMVVAMPVPNLTTIEETTLDAAPRWAFYGPMLQHPSIMGGLAVRILDQLSVGAGVGLLVNVPLAIDLRVPALVPEDEFEARIEGGLSPVVAAHVGVAWTPIPELRLGLAWRSVLYSRLQVPVTTDIEAAGVLLEVDILLEAVKWYSPHQVALGIAGDPLPWLTVAADVTWYHWSGYPGPWLVATPKGDETSVAASINYPPREEPGFKDIVVPRFGVEARWRDRLAGRLGYSWRASPAPIPSQRANLLDNPTHTISLGGGWTFRHRDADPHATAWPRRYDGQGSGIPLSRRHFLTLDGYARLSVLSPRQVDKGGAEDSWNRYAYGGTWFDLGASATYGWL